MILTGKPSVYLSGAGWGHGVGLCQIGAAVMATRGFSAEEILKHYFRGAEIRRSTERWILTMNVNTGSNPRILDLFMQIIRLNAYSVLKEEKEFDEGTKGFGSHDGEFPSVTIR